MFDIVENMIFGKVDNADIVDNDTADELAVEDDGFADIVNNDFDDVKKMFDKDENVENKYQILDKIDIVEKVLLDKDFDIVETDKQKEFRSCSGGL